MQSLRGYTQLPSDQTENANNSMYARINLVLARPQERKQHRTKKRRFGGGHDLSENTPPTDAHLLQLLPRNDLLSLHGRQHGQDQVLAVVKLLFDLLVHVIAVQVQLEVRTSIVLRVHQRNVRLVIHIHQLKIVAVHQRLEHVVGRRRDILVLPLGEDVNASDVGLGVAVLARLRRPTRTRAQNKIQAAGGTSRTKN
eukprot:contig_3418_g726